MNELTAEEMRTMINLKVTQVYPKLLKDAKQVSGYNFNQYGYDLLYYTLEKFLCDKPVEYQYKVAITDNKLANYIGRAMSTHIKSSTSSFWHKYRKEAYNSRGVYEAEYRTEDTPKTLEYSPDYINEDFDSPYLSNDLGECVVWALNNIHWYYRQILTDYYIENLTYMQIHKKYNISLNSIAQDIKKGHKLIKELCQS